MYSRGIATLLAALAWTASAHAGDDKGIFNLIWENDMFAGADRNYTNGIRLGWLSSEENVPDWAHWTAFHLLPLNNDGEKRVSFALGQSMFTPMDITLANPPLSDRPYAGWLYASLGMVSDTGTTLDNAMLTVGMVGPKSFAELTQRFVHSLSGSPDPKGWDHQLKNEPGIVLTYERKWRGLYEFTPFGVGADMTPHIGANLGNVYTDASVGATFRLGYDLPADYGPPRIRPSLPGSDFFIPTQAVGGYLFAGFEGRAVARNIFLDGNSFTESPHVEKEPFVGGIQAGAAITFGMSRISYTHIWMTREFDTQQRLSQFGAISYSYRF